MNRTEAEKVASEIYGFLIGIDWSTSNVDWKIARLADIIERAGGRPDSPLTPYGEELRQKSFKDGLRAMRVLIRDELDKKDSAMKHDHNPAVRTDAQWEYCWRCRIERVLDSEIGGYHTLSNQRTNRILPVEVVRGERSCGETAWVSGEPIERWKHDEKEPRQLHHVLDGDWVRYEDHVRVCDQLTRNWQLRWLAPFTPNSGGKVMRKRKTPLMRPFD